jgi:hypothetical protein
LLAIAGFTPGVFFEVVLSAFTVVVFLVSDFFCISLSLEVISPASAGCLRLCVKQRSGQTTTGN